MASLHVKIKPGSSCDEIVFEEGILMIKIKTRPIDGVANKYLIEFLSEEFKLAKTKINIEKGTAGRFKKLVVGLDDER